MSTPPIGRYRWTIVALLFAATTINYIDRNVLGYLKQTLTDAFHWDNLTYGTINGVFQFFYAFDLLGFGWMVDLIGPKMGYGIAISVSSIFALAHALAGTTVLCAIAPSGL